MIEIIEYQFSSAPSSPKKLRGIIYKVDTAESVTGPDCHDKRYWTLWSDGDNSWIGDRDKPLIISEAGQ